MKMAAFKITDPDVDPHTGSFGTLISLAQAIEDDGIQQPFVFEAEAEKVHNEPEIGVWTDGCGVYTEESLEDRKAGFVPAYRLKVGRRYRVTIEDLG
jgi:hypothetical protein